jgi:hypothetical protein
VTTKIPYQLLKNATPGSIFIWNAAGTPTPLAAGAANTVLTSAGAGATPTFSAVGGVGTDALFTSEIFVDTVGFTAGTSTTVTLASPPSTEDFLIVFFDGAVQQRDQYSLSGAIITFTSAIPALTAKIEVYKLSGGVTTVALTGPVTSVGNATTIASGVVTLANMANVATSTVFYRKTAGTGSPEVQTLATLKTDLDLTGTNSGDQTNITGNAGTATALQTARTIDGISFNGTANITVIAPATNAATSKATPVDADVMPLADSAAAFVLKKLSWANIKATLQTYFDTLYYPTAGLQFESADQTITSGGSLTIAHGLGYTPIWNNIWLVCQTAELGYTAGDIVLWTTGGNNRGVSFVVDDTNAYVRYGSAVNVFELNNKTTGATASATNANWKMRFVLE